MQNWKDDFNAALSAFRAEFTQGMADVKASMAQKADRSTVDAMQIRLTSQEHKVGELEKERIRRESEADTLSKRELRDEKRRERRSTVRYALMAAAAAILAGAIGGILPGVLR